ncbi:MAG: stalk domain-containing protein [Bacillota bacterium]
MLKRIGLTMVILLLFCTWLNVDYSATAQSNERYILQRLDIDVRFNSAYKNEDGTLRGTITVYQGKDVQEISKFEMYVIDEQRKPIAKIEDISLSSAYDCIFQDEHYRCMHFEADKVPYPDNAFGIGVYAESDKSLQNALVVAPIWKEALYNGDYFAQNPVFIDELPVAHEVKGKLTWEAAVDESRISGYEVYMSFYDVKSTTNSLKYAGNVSKGNATYSLDIPETTFTSDDRLDGFKIYSKSPFGGLSSDSTYLKLEEDKSGGSNEENIYGGNSDKVAVPDTVKPIPAPKAPMDKPPIQVFVDGDKLDLQTDPYLYKGTTLVQFRPIFEKLGLSIKWDAKNKKITGSKQALMINLTIGQSMAMVNGESKKLAVAPQIRNNSTYVPLRFIGEATGRKVIWDANLPAIYIIDSATEGKLYYPDGTLMYEGQLVNGKMNGKGKLYSEDGTLWYDAEFVDNEVTGLGTIYFGRSAVPNMPGEDIMIGGFLNGLPHGHSKYYYGDGSLAYDGQFENGSRTTGKQYDKGILVYEGQWKNKMYHGNGKYYKNGFLYYEGEFAVNAEHGRGKYYNEAGYVRIEGESKNGILDGPAKMYYPNGQVDFDGEFKKGMMSGEVRRYYPNGNLEFSGIYEGGNRISGRYYYPDGTFFEGDFFASKPFEGKVFNRQGELVYEGKLKNGKPPHSDRIYGTFE